MHVYTDGFLPCFSLADSGLYSVHTSEKRKPRFRPLSFLPLFPLFLPSFSSFFPAYLK